MAKKKTAAKSMELDAKEFFAAISDIEKEKGIPKSYMIEKITQALVAAYKRDHEGITDNVEAFALSYGIDVVDIKIKRFDLPESNENAVYERMISEREQMAAAFSADGSYEASLIRNDVNRQVNILISDAEAMAAQLVAEGEAEYMRMLAEAYNTPEKREFYTFMLALDALEASLTGEDKTVVLGPDSPLAQLLIAQ